MKQLIFYITATQLLFFISAGLLLTTDAKVDTAQFSLNLLEFSYDNIGLSEPYRNCSIFNNTVNSTVECRIEISAVYFYSRDNSTLQASNISSAFYPTVGFYSFQNDSIQQLITLYGVKTLTNVSFIGTIIVNSTITINSANSTNTTTNTNSTNTNSTNSTNTTTTNNTNSNNNTNDTTGSSQLLSMVLFSFSIDKLTATNETRVLMQNFTSLIYSNIAFTNITGTNMTNTNLTGTNLTVGYLSLSYRLICFEEFTGENCTQCSNPRYTGQACNMCVYPFDGINCTDCLRNYTGINCDTCLPNFNGSDCELCVPHYTGMLCDHCETHFDINTNCTQCLDRFRGDTCNDCIDFFEGSECDRCQYGYVPELINNGRCNVIGKCYWDRWCSPGNCSSFFQNCTCAPGFSPAPYCNEISLSPMLLFASIAVSTNTTNTTTTRLLDIVSGTNFTYTNDRSTYITQIKWKGLFNKALAFQNYSNGIQPKPTIETHFDVLFNASKIGIVDQRFEVLILNGTGSVRDSFNDSTYSLYCTNGSIASIIKPAESLYTCCLATPIALPLPNHQDRLVFKVFFTAGGYLDLDRRIIETDAEDNDSSINCYYQNTTKLFCLLKNTSAYNAVINGTNSSDTDCVIQNMTSYYCNININNASTILNTSDCFNRTLSSYTCQNTTANTINAANTSLCYSTNVTSLYCIYVNANASLYDTGACLINQYGIYCVINGQILLINASQCFNRTTEENICLGTDCSYFNSSITYCNFTNTVSVLERRCIIMQPNSLLYCYDNQSNNNTSCITQIEQSLDCSDDSNYATFRHVEFYSRPSATISISGEIEWDFVEPYNTPLTNETILLLNPVVNIMNRTVSVSWSGYFDPDSGIVLYTLRVFRLLYNNSTGNLSESLQPAVAPLSFNFSNAIDNYATSIQLLNDSIYSFVLEIEDLVGNVRLARRFYLTDNTSVVLLDTNSVLNIPSSVTVAEMHWQTNLNLTVILNWKNHFYNSNLRPNKWLAPISPYREGKYIVEDAYDQIYHAELPISGIQNIDGIIEFSYYNVTHNGSLVNNSDFEPDCNNPSLWAILNNFPNQETNFTLTRKDGYESFFWVRAKDYYGKYNCDNITLKYDSTPPDISIIGILFLDHKGQVIHNSFNLDTIEFEFTVYDAHSGLMVLEWKLGTARDYNDIGLGYITISNNCSQTSQTCICTPKEMCYESYFRFGIPQADLIGTPINQFQDIYFTIIATNLAGLVSSDVYYFFIDVTPPTTGVAIDNIQGGLDLDFSSTNQLRVSWNGFNDYETGIQFYQYACEFACIPTDQFAYPITSSNVARAVKSTYETSALCVPLRPGKYYLSVVAFNYGFLHSAAACSDGILYDKTPPFIGNITFTDVRFFPGLVRYDNQLWLIDSSGMRTRVDHNTNNNTCIASATEIQDIGIYPLSGTSTITLSTACDMYAPFNNTAYQSVSRQVILKWSGFDIESGILRYEISITSSLNTSDILSFTDINLQTYYTAYPDSLTHATIYFVKIRATNHALLQTTITSGPVIIDTTGPLITGSITAVVNSTHTTTSWSEDTFMDGEFPSEPLTYAVAVGTAPDTSNMLPFSSTLPYPCITASNVSGLCVTISQLSLNDRLHSNYRYYIILRVTNYAGISVIATSNAITLLFDPPTHGVIRTINNYLPDSLSCHASLDITHQISVDSISVCWTGFTHAFDEVTYSLALGTAPNSSNVYNFTTVNSQLHSYTVNGLLLSDFTQYYATIIASNTVGQVMATTNGVLVISPNSSLNHTYIHAGNLLESDVTAPIDYQVSLTSFSVRWQFPDTVKPFIFYYLLSLYKLNDGGAIEPIVTNINAGLSTSHHLPSLSLINAANYTASIQACHSQDCFRPVFSNQVTIIHSPPIAGYINTSYVWNTMTYPGNASVTNSIITYWQPFIDADESTVYNYMWSYGRSSDANALLIDWLSLNMSDSDEISGLYRFEYNLGRTELSTVKLYYSNIQAYGKTQLRSFISYQISVTSLVSIERSVVDVIQDNLVLPRGDTWNDPDRDFTPTNSRIQAVWPTYAQFKYFIIGISTENTNIGQCDDSSVVICTNTTEIYVTIDMPALLTDGERYYVCLLGTDNEDLSGASFIACSDGITVDLYPPTRGEVQLGFFNSAVDDRAIAYQTGNSELFVRWSGFFDVSGISHYECGIGSSSGVSDIHDYVNVGIVNFYNFYQLNLSFNLIYYATVRAYDHIGRVSAKSSNSLILDRTPPTPGTIYVGTATQSASSSTNRLYTADIRVHWVGFTDAESGIYAYEWAVGSGKGFSDILGYTSTTDTTGQLYGSQIDSVYDGITLYISIKATNRASLYSITFSEPVIIDTTPPTIGDIYDGTPGQGVLDIDYQQDISRIRAYWNHFTDPDSPYINYEWGIGTCPNCTNVMSYTYVGHVTAATSNRHLTLKTNIEYYAVVRGCNEVNLCVVSVGDGVRIDRTPPVTGVVYDGFNSRDIDYQGLRHHITGQFFGFSDPESGISHYEWCIGTVKGGCNLQNFSGIHEAQYVFHTLRNNELLPLSMRIYLTIRAWNRAEMSITSSSDGFIVDISPPVFNQQVAFDFTQGSVYNNSTVARNSIKVTWRSSDPESIVTSHSVTIYNTGSVQDSTSVVMGGSENVAVFTDLNLHDGYQYYVVVTACNVINLCYHSSSASNVLIDASPPILGSFAYDHPVLNFTSGKQRNVTQMLWYTSTDTNRNTTFQLAWLGFYDPHSGIKQYFVSVGNVYYGNDLTSNGYQMFQPLDITTNNVQVHNITLSDRLYGNNNQIYVTLWAENGAGIFSTFLHQVFIVEAPTINNSSSGVLKILRYNCSTVTCDQQCACASPGRLCSQPAPCNCTTNNTTHIEIRDITVLNGADTNMAPDVQDTRFTSFLAAQWQPTNSNNIMFYQVAVSIRGLAAGQDLFNPTTDRIWHDVGLLTRYIYPLPYNIKLVNGVEYVIHIRAWLGPCERAEFTSSGVIVDVNRPMISDKMQVREVNINGIYDSNDIDYVDDSIGGIRVSWNNVFTDAETPLVAFEVALGSNPYEADVYQFEYVGSNTSHVFAPGLISGVTYYCTVRGYDASSLVAESTSDGVIVDRTSPVAGVVLDGRGTNGVDITFQSDNSSISAQWKYFIDKETGVLSYMWSLGTAPYPDADYTSLLDSYNVNLNIRGTVTNRILTHNTTYYSTIVAIDILSHSSQNISSDGVTVDTTPPIPMSCTQPIYKLASPITFANAKQILSIDNTIINGFYQTLLCVNFMSANGNIIPTSFILQFSVGNVVQEINLVSGQDFKSAVCQIYYIPFMATSSTTELSLNLTNPLYNITIEQLSIYSCIESENNSIIVHNQQSAVPNILEFSWLMVDRESGLCDYSVAIGNSPRNQQILSYTKVGVVTSYIARNLDIYHGLALYITVIGENCAGLKRVFDMQEPWVPDITPPVLDRVWDGSGEIDSDATNVSIIYLRFSPPVDRESTLLNCEWSIGYAPKTSDFRGYQKISPPDLITGLVSTGMLTNWSTDTTLYSTLRCVNTAQLQSEQSTDGIVHSTVVPNSEYADVSVRMQESTPYIPLAAIKNTTEVIIQWNNFTDSVSIADYNLKIIDGSNNITVYEINTGLTLSIRLNLDNILLDGGNYSIDVRAVNAFGGQSDYKNTHVAADLMDPTIIARDNCQDYNSVNLSTYNLNEVQQIGCIEFQWLNSSEELYANWAMSFNSTFKSQLRYEISFGSSLDVFDLLQWITTMETDYKHKLINYSGNARIIITAISPSGRYITLFSDSIAI